MGFIGQFKNPVVLLFVIFGLMFCTSGIVSRLYAEDSRETSQETQNTPSSEPVDNEAETTPDNNSGTSEQSENSENNDSDPNSPPDPNSPLEMTNEEEMDDFSPRISTYLKINEAYEKLFNPNLVTDDGLVRYGNLRRKRNDLIQATNELKRLNPAVLMSLSKEQRIAFWINTYNACTLKLIIDNYPIEPKLYMIFYPDNSIMQISGNWRTKHFFDIQGLEYNLEEIEQEFLMKRYKDPRLCFALSYASMGGAVLRNEPYAAEKLDEQLDDQVRKYLQSSKGFGLDKEKNILHLSTLFSMYNHKEFFLNSDYAKIKKFRTRKPEEQAWLNFIINYLPKEDIRYLEAESFEVKLIKYDWLLNEAH